MGFIFMATEAGFQDGLGGASNSKGATDYHYVLYGVQEDKQHPANSGVYFEYDDQLNGGVNQVNQVDIKPLSVAFKLSDGSAIVVDCRLCKAQWDDFMAGIQATFPQAIVIVDGQETGQPEPA